MDSIYNFSGSNFVLMLSGQILFFLFIIGVIIFGVPQMSFPANSMRTMLSEMKMAPNSRIAK